MLGQRALTAFFLLIALFGVGLAQEKGQPLTLEKIEEALREGALPQGRLATIIRDQGVSFEVTEEAKARLRRMGADVVVMQAVERALYINQIDEEMKRTVRDAATREEAYFLDHNRYTGRVEDLIAKYGLNIPVGVSLEIELPDRVSYVVKAVKPGGTAPFWVLNSRDGRLSKGEQAGHVVYEEKRNTADANAKGKKDEGEMVVIPAGVFFMGCNEKADRECHSDEKPGKRVYVDAFYMDKYEVTNGLYRRFMEATGQQAPSFWNDTRFNGSNQPVVGVTWHDADAYCRWAGKRLPTEAEWEKAARGTDWRKYPWGDQWDSSRANAGNKLGKTAPVGFYPGGASPYGVHDMAGNVWEWVADWYDANYYQRAPDRNPKGPDSGRFRVLRGGSWDSHPGDLRASYRWVYPPFRGIIVGFRCAQ